MTIKNRFMIIKIVFLGMLVLITSGCVSKKEIQLESLSITTLKKIENGYNKNKFFQYKTLGNCILRFKDRREKLMKTSNNFLKINFTSKETMNIFEDRRAALYIHLKADNKSLESLSFCPLVEKTLEGYSYSYFYPTQYKRKKEYFQPKAYDDYETFDLKKIKELKFQIVTVGYSRWKTNTIVITKDMIDKLKF